MNKQVMFNEYEAITPEALSDFEKAESDIRAHIKALSEKYRLIEVEQYLMSTVSGKCAELRLRNAMAMKTKNREEKKASLRNERIQNATQA